ncbi:MAG: ATP phosphoribosyltransferase [Chloroflexi bacterium]|nr:ATP phosphoribosyltransferase [Chloroflexota bacterium]
MEKLTIALPKGRLQDQMLDLITSVGYVLPQGALTGRKLVFYDQSQQLRFIMAKPVDVPTYVEYGAADLGIAGLDVLRESKRELYEPLRLGFGKCRLVLAGPPEARNRNLRLVSNLRVATKYPRLALDYFYRQGISAEIIPLSGSVELAPVVGLADLLVDLVETGTTLRDNGLVELETLLESEAVVVVNRASHKLHFQLVQELINRLAEEIGQRAGGSQTDAN